MLAPFPSVYMIDGLGEGLNMCKTYFVIVTVIGITACAYLLYYLYILNNNKCLLDA